MEIHKTIIEQGRAAFRAEGAELLTALDEALLALETEPGNSEFVHRVFRAIHTVKGTGATVGFTHLAAVAHRIEEAFDLARSGRLAITPELVDCGLKGCDVLRAILTSDDPEAEHPLEAEVALALDLLLPASTAQEGDKERGAKATDKGSMHAYDVVLRPHPDFFHSGSDPVTLLDELRSLGQAHVRAHCDRVPLLSDIDAESCYLWWEVRLVCACPESRIREAFLFVEDDCDIAIRLNADQNSAIAFVGAIPAETLDLFVAECQERLDEIERDAGSLRDKKWSREALDGVFRAVHSIKGNAGVLLAQLPASSLPARHSLPLLSRVAHALESVLDRYRADGARAVSGETAAFVLETRDAMQALLENLSGHAGAPPISPELLRRLGLEAVESGAKAEGANPAFANAAGQCMEIFVNCLEQFSNQSSPPSTLKTYLRALKTLSSAAAYAGRNDLDEALGAQSGILETAVRAERMLTATELTRLQSLFELVRARLESPSHASSGEEDQKPATDAPRTAVASAQGATIRIDQEKLDRLMRIVGELLVARGAFPVLLDKLDSGEDRASLTRSLKETGAGISHIAEELQASVMSIRMLPVKAVFQRFPRMVRDLARSLGKDVQLVVEGESTELDKSILDSIGDPLVHLVRNSVDHGLEAAELRRQHGKNAQGKVTLRAANVGGSVVIEVEDDGRGLDVEALKRKAVGKGLVGAAEAASMSHADACRLVFLPGLSTAEKVTDVSGRGVGMDVVASNVRSLHGTVDIHSTPGTGTVFTIKLPTSLIISKGILLEAGGEEYILPLASIRDMLKIPASEVHQYGGRKLAQARGEVHGLYSLAELLGFTPQPADEVPIAIIDTGKERYGLIADRFVSEVEVLVKPLSGVLGAREEFHGAAIMGDGRVVLVLNPAECCRAHVVEAA